MLTSLVYLPKKRDILLIIEEGPAISLTEVSPYDKVFWVGLFLYLYLHLHCRSI